MKKKGKKKVEKVSQMRAKIKGLEVDHAKPLSGAESANLSHNLACTCIRSGCSTKDAVPHLLLNK
jgi:hypothetical protein